MKRYSSPNVVDISYKGKYEATQASTGTLGMEDVWRYMFTVTYLIEGRPLFVKIELAESHRNELYVRNMGVIEHMDLNDGLKHRVQNPDVDDLIKALKKVDILEDCLEGNNRTASLIREKYF